jgi:excisionase family DNA binding protein
MIAVEGKIRTMAAIIAMPRPPVGLASELDRMDGATAPAGRRDNFEDDVIDAKAAARILKIHPVTVRLKAAAGEIPGHQIGNRWRFSRSRLIELIRAA